jgi:hypothetical protein
MTEMISRLVEVKAAKGFSLQFDFVCGWGFMWFSLTGERLVEWFVVVICTLGLAMYSWLLYFVAAKLWFGTWGSWCDRELSIAKNQLRQLVDMHM